ncbi:MAG: leucine-rich repeat protein [Clostridia bacterium]|nr:leucine-rich repeat protein [Clostridia bacterium]
MIKRKRILGIIVLIIMLCKSLCMPMLVYAEEETTYTHAKVASGYSNKGMFEVSTALTQLTIPGQIDEEDVKQITKVKSKNGQKISSITFPSTLTNISSGACSNLGLQNVNIPNGVKEIGSQAFNGNELTSINLPNLLTSLESAVLSNNQLTTINIPNSVTSIGDSALAGNKLYSVSIPGAVTEIGGSAFFNNSLQTIELPDSVERVGKSAFAKNKLKTVKLSNSLETIESMAFSENDLQTVEIPASVKSIGQGAFSNNKLESVKIPNSVESIESTAFTNNNLRIVDIPSSVKSIGTQCFDGNENLSTVIIRSKNVKISKNAIYIPQKNKASFVVYGYPNSASEEYAKSAGVKFEDIANLDDSEEDGKSENADAENEKEHGNNESEKNGEQQESDKQEEDEKAQQVNVNNFIWGEDNYNFTNSWDYFSSYYIGDFVNNISDLYYEYFADNWRDSRMGWFVQRNGRYSVTV